MSSPWTSPDPTQSDNQAGQEAHSSQPGYAPPAAGTAYTAPGTQSGYTAPGPGPGYTAPGPGPGYTAAANSAPDASGYSQGAAWGWAPKPGIIPLRPLVVGDLLKGSFSALRKNPAVLFGFTLIVTSVVALASGALVAVPFFGLSSMGDTLSDPQATADSLGDSFTLWFIGIVLGYVGLLALSGLGGVLLDGVLASAVSQLVIGKKATFREALAQVKPRLLAMVGTTLLLMLIVGAPLMLWAVVFIATFFAYGAVGAETVINTVFAELALLLPVSLGCFALAVRCLYAPICVVLEQRRPVEAIKRSWALTRGTFWLTFGRLFLISFITSFIAGMINQVLGSVLSIIMFATIDPSAQNPFGSTSFIASAAVLVGIQTLSYALIVPITSAYQTLMYVDERIRRENFAIILAQASQA